MSARPFVINGVVSPLALAAAVILGACSQLLPGQANDQAPANNGGGDACAASTSTATANEVDATATTGSKVNKVATAGKANKSDDGVGDSTQLMLADPSVSYEGQVKQILQAKCNGCHLFTPPTLGTYKAAKAAGDRSIASIKAGKMPRGAPLSSAQKQVLLDWQAAGYPEKSGTILSGGNTTKTSVATATNINTNTLVTNDANDADTLANNKVKTTSTKVSTSTKISGDQNVSGGKDPGACPPAQ